MPLKRKDRPLSSPTLFKGPRKSPQEKTIEKRELLGLAENLRVKIEAILKKLEKLDVIELQPKEVHAKVASIEFSKQITLGDPSFKDQNKKVAEEHGGT